MKEIRYIDIDFIVDAHELAEAFGCTERNIQTLTQEGVISFISNYKEKGSKAKYYRLGLAMQQYKDYLFIYRGNPEAASLWLGDKPRSEEVTFYEEKKKGSRSNGKK